MLSQMADNKLISHLEKLIRDEGYPCTQHGSALLSFMCQRHIIYVFIGDSAYTIYLEVPEDAAETLCGSIQAVLEFNYIRVFQSPGLVLKVFPERESIAICKTVAVYDLQQELNNVVLSLVEYKDLLIAQFLSD